VTAPRSGLPRPAATFIWAVACVGAAAAAAMLTRTPHWTARDAAAWAGLAAAVAVSEQFWIELRHRTERENFSLTDALFVGSLLLFRPSVTVLAVGAGALAGQAWRRVAPLKVAFNVGQFLLSLTAAVAVVDAIGEHGAGRPLAWLAAAAGMAAYLVINTSSVALVIALVEGDRFRKVVLPTLPLTVTHSAGNVAVGLLTVVVWDAEPAALPLLVLPLGLVYLAYRGWLRSDRVRQRMGEIAASARAISQQGDLATRLPEGGEVEEVAALAGTLNGMLGRLEASYERERQLIEEISHELRTPITIVRGHLEVLQLGRTDPELAETVAVVIDELARMARLIEDMTTLARAGDPGFLRPASLPVERFLADVAGKAAPLVGARLVVVAPAADATVMADEQRLTQALVNLIANAGLHGKGQAPIELRAVAGPGAWRFEVADGGGGLPVGEEERVFRPFQRLNGTTPGQGLGLAIVRGIAQAHGGEAGVDNEPGVGATFWVTVPA
jgi:signal transduction histidine kinase